MPPLNKQQTLLFEWGVILPAFALTLSYRADHRSRSRHHDKEQDESKPKDKSIINDFTAFHQFSQVTTSEK